METAFQSIEELIAAVLDDISQKGYSSIQPFSIGNVELDHGDGSGDPLLDSKHCSVFSERCFCYQFFLDGKVQSLAITL